MTTWTSRGHKRVDGCDVVVVGAGLVGAMVAARLSDEGFDVAVLEARTVASGATGRSAGMVLTGLPGYYNWAASAYGRQQAQEVWALTIEGQERLVEHAQRLGVPVEHTGSLALAVDDAEADALRESTELLHEDGFDVQFESGDPLHHGFHAALRHLNDVTVDAAALTQALLATGDVAVHEGTEVHDLEPEGGGMRVWAQGRTVLCEAVVLAVNGYAALLDFYFTDKVAPVRSLTLTTATLDGVVLETPCCADYGHEYCRQLPDRRLLVGTWRCPPSHPQHSALRAARETQGAEPGDLVRDELLRFTTRYFPEIDPRKTRQRSGVMGFTPDGLPLVGQLPDLPQAYFAVGLGGRGLAWAAVVAERLVALMLHDTDPGILAPQRLS